jgi:CheY-like chemotaxis protein
MPLRALELVLLVEDDHDLRQFLGDFLVLEGFNVRTAEHGIEALRFLEQKTPALVVLDLALPWMDGFGVLSVMRQKPQTAEIPVVVITGTQATEAQLRHFAPVHLLRKPFTTDDLLKLVLDLVPGVR